VAFWLLQHNFNRDSKLSANQLQDQKPRHLIVHELSSSSCSIILHPERCIIAQNVVQRVEEVGVVDVHGSAGGCAQRNLAMAAEAVDIYALQVCAYTLLLPGRDLRIE
jgi:hypothetical protein